MNKGLFLTILLYLTLWSCLVMADDTRTARRRRMRDAKRFIHRGNENLRTAGKEGTKAAEDYAQGIKKSLQTSSDYLMSLSSKGYDLLKSTIEQIREKAHDAAEEFEIDDETYYEMLEEKYNHLKQKVDEYSRSIQNTATGKPARRRRTPGVSLGETLGSKLKSALGGDSASKVKSTVENTIGMPGRDRIRDVGDRAYQMILEEQQHLKDKFTHGKESVGEVAEDWLEKGKDATADAVGDWVEKGKEVTGEVVEDLVEKGKEYGEKGKRIGENVIERALDYGKAGIGAVRKSVKKTISGLEAAQRDAFIREHAQRLLNVLENAEKSIAYARDISEDFIDEIVKKTEICERRRLRG